MYSPLVHWKPTKAVVSIPVVTVVVQLLNISISNFCK